MIDLTIPGVPVAKGRPRATRTGRMYTPQKTRDAEADFRFAVRERRQSMLPGPLRVTLVFTMPIAKSWPKKEREGALVGTYRPTGKPDLDNLIKLATDALNGVLWVDDSQIVEMTASKRYGAEPSTRIVVDLV